MKRWITRHKVVSAVVAAAAVVAVVAVAYTLLRRDGATVDPPVSRYPVRGIDVSNHNGYIDFDRVAADSIRFVYVKATEGTTFNDNSFHRNFHAAKRAGLMVGVYHFFRFDRSGEGQAINLMHALRGKEIDLPVAIDVEQWTNPTNHSTDSVAQRIGEMITYLTDRGIPVVIYTNRSGLRKFVNLRFSDVPLWSCDFRRYPTSARTLFWQYSHSGSVRGVRGDVDRNVFCGNVDSWNAHLLQWRTSVR